MADISEENIRIGHMLKSAREQKQVLQSEMAEAVGITKNHVSALERGVHKTSIYVLLGYCRKLDMTPNDILGYGTEEILIPELKDLLSATTRVQQQRIFKMVKILLEENQKRR